MRETGQADAVRWAAMITRRSDVLYLDTETTGLGKLDEIVDIAVIDNDGRVLLDTLVKPQRPIPAAATAIHRIADHHVVGAPAWPEVYPGLLELLDGHHHVVVYNADFDRRLIQQCCATHRLAPPVTRWHCAMKQYAAFVGDLNPQFGDYRWHNLNHAVRRFKLHVVADHRALSDTRACWSVVRAMAAVEPARSAME